METWAGGWGERRVSTIEVIYIKRSQENEGVNIAFFALLMGDVSDPTMINVILLKAGRYSVICPTTCNTE